MKIISAEDFELLSFFEVEPELMDTETPWAYNDAVYHVSKNDLHLSFAIQPSCKDVRLILKQDKHILYELNAMAVLDVRIHADKDNEVLEIIASENESITLRLKPFLSIKQKLERGI